MFYEIYQHLSVNGLLDQQQSVILSGDSTINQLLSLTQSTIQHLKRVFLFWAVFLDLSNVFYKVWQKLKCTGINGNLFISIEIYLDSVFEW